MALTRITSATHFIGIVWLYSSKFKTRGCHILLSCKCVKFFLLLLLKNFLGSYPSLQNYVFSGILLKYSLSFTNQLSFFYLYFLVYLQSGFTSHLSVTVAFCCDLPSKDQMFNFQDIQYYISKWLIENVVVMVVVCVSISLERFGMIHITSVLVLSTDDLPTSLKNHHQVHSWYVPSLFRTPKEKSRAQMSDDMWIGHWRHFYYILFYTKVICKISFVCFMWNKFSLILSVSIPIFYLIFLLKLCTFLHFGWQIHHFSIFGGIKYPNSLPCVRHCAEHFMCNNTQKSHKIWTSCHIILCIHIV